MIVLDDFSKSYGHRFAVKNLSFTAETGCITALTGLNGAGKTTVLKAVCSIHYADMGSVRVNGIDAEQDSVQNKRQIGFMSEQSIFPRFFTVYEFLYYEALILCAEKRDSETCTSEKKAGEAVERVIALCDLEEFAGKKTVFLSNGEKRRTALARCLLHDPAVLVLDEPAAGLDPKQSARMRSLIADISKTKTVLFSTHLLGEAENLCSKIIILHKGSLAAAGGVEELCRKTGTRNLEQAFLHIIDGKASDAY